jgi:hypothetical protein
MTSYPTHAKRRHHPALEWSLWLTWRVAGALGAVVIGTVVGYLIRPVRRVLHAGHRGAATVAHRLTARLGRVTAPVIHSFDAAGDKLRRQSTTLLIAGIMLANLLWLALR